MSNYFIKSLLFLIIYSFLFKANAQVVNIEKNRKDANNGFSGIIGLGFFFTDNGKKISQLRNTIDLQFDHNEHTLILINDLNLMRVNDENLVNGGFQHLRYNYTIKDSSFLTIEAFFQHQYNPIKLLERRLLWGTGIRFRVLETKSARMYFGALGMYEIEKLSDSLKTENRLVRMSSYISMGWDLNPNIKLNSISYFQPAFTDFSNFRFSMETSVKIKMTTALSFKTGIQLNYDANAPENIQKLFYFWENQLTYDF